MHVCLVVPARDGRAEHVIAAIRAHTPAARFSAVWTGDPQRRPVAARDAAWIDTALPEVEGLDWNHLLVALAPATYSLARGAAAVGRLLVDPDAEPIALLRVGSVGVTGALDEFMPATGVVVARRAPQVFAADGMSPSAVDLAIEGAFSSALIGFAADAAEQAGAIARSAVAGGAVSPGAALAAALAWASGAVAESDAVHVAGWRDPGSDDTGGIVAVDVTSLSDDEPWQLDFGAVPSRTRLSDHPQLAEALDATRAQWEGDHCSITLPGGIAVDDVVRGLAIEAIGAWRRGEGPLPPDPWGDSPSDFVEWLETPWPPWGPDIGRYWSRLHSTRPDLAQAFPHPEGGDLPAFTAWAASNWRHERRSPLLRPSSRPMRPAWYDDSRRPGGVNLIGYLGTDNSLGDLVRRIRRCLDAAGVPLAALDYHRSGSPPSADRGETTDRVCFDTNVVVINPDQLALFDADYGAVTRPGRRTIGFWHWDVEYVPRHVIDATRFVDEIWVVSPFTGDALRAVVDVPVHVVDVPVPQPVPAADPPEGLGVGNGRYTFLVTFDHLSLTERKNPIGAIDAFRLAFPEPQPGGPQLVVKSVNAAHRRRDHERIRLATDFRPDIRVVDSRLERASQLALIRDADCLVSLHRSEGLGLHLIEAMWLGTPTIATRYSGNLYFQDDTNAALVDAVLVPVTRGEGFFPAAARWADPDLGQAAHWMRELVDAPGVGAALADAARAKMRAQPTQAEAGAHIARIAGLAVSKTSGEER